MYDLTITTYLCKEFTDNNKSMSTLNALLGLHLLVVKNVVANVS